ncbi:MAG: transcriptional regulator [Microcoleus sp. PH2017_29_MFU_D_A]|jgi:HTH-type transcriptional regulator/antitoxin HigA|uniref:helix-turn-helix domain-containing protein n=1 Tax=unclassified Microcoleus TaxID=2642155 RepID=UPI001DB78586|nr:MULTISPECIES: transcriptional regulator [unclassified Microcoleus]TAE54244.1 MAG: transcriptional regulator [Oscillatoriales cyanobacterium]MCC3452010.1 transcriptional regulator [Microcoleus sp. PH2017_08_TRC_O_A]MCC3470594.1 transcriptional regulator [Microcoleus sp. PH2017_13_LAR_U_A]MCC3483119.1 transcriptional regulator [Microcoleus sp. PH2017_14_LAR_D_A]MCC3583380.1 transcriptional regulator [Microcoleus sp. PH2017_30_WIL_O_A]
MNNFPPRQINCEADLIATQNRINSILDRRKLTQDDRDYLNVLGILVYDYEQKHEPMPVLKGIKLLKALMVEAELSEKDLVDIFSTESLVAEVLNGNRELTVSQIQKLAELFHLSPGAFFE